jgi:hypothetical protein
VQPGFDVVFLHTAPMIFTGLFRVAAINQWPLKRSPMVQ